MATRAAPANTEPVSWMQPTSLEAEITRRENTRHIDDQVSQVGQSDCSLAGTSGWSAFCVVPLHSLQDSQLHPPFVTVLPAHSSGSTPGIATQPGAVHYRAPCPFIPLASPRQSNAPHHGERDKPRTLYLSERLRWGFFLVYSLFFWRRKGTAHKVAQDFCGVP